MIYVSRKLVRGVAKTHAAVQADPCSLLGVVVHEKRFSSILGSAQSLGHRKGLQVDSAMPSLPWLAAQS